MKSIADYRLAAYAVRQGQARPDGLSEDQWSALLLAESPGPQWRTLRGQLGYAEVRRAIRGAWSWEVADAYRGPSRPGGVVKTLFKPNGRCGYCDRFLSGESLTFCTQECRRYYIRRAARGGKPRVCRTDGCGVELGEEFKGHYCTDCQDVRRAAEMDADDLRWEHPCATEGCDYVAVWDGKGRPPRYCVECRDPKRLARERKRRERARKRAAATDSASNDAATLTGAAPNSDEWTENED